MLLTQACLTSSISISFTEDGLSDAQKDIKKIQKDLVRTDNEHLAISNKLTECRKQNAIILERLLQFDTYIRRENLKFSGVSEGQNEVPQDKVRDILKNQLAIDSSETMDFQNATGWDTNQKTANLKEILSLDLPGLRIGRQYGKIEESLVGLLLL